jgi:uncharacterized protein (TIGR00661 family)
MKVKRVLIAPLDWGLGHATRCIPIIEALQKRDCEVFIAASGSSLSLLKKEFPNLSFFSLPSYRIQYPRSGSFVFSMVKQISKIRRAITKEHKRIQKIIRENKIELIISDNRYGCWSDAIPSIFVSHQLNIQLPGGWQLLKPILDRFHNGMIKKFNQCWIPDDPQFDLTGELSKNGVTDVKHIGILSRFKKQDAEVKYDVAVVLSGPEPQRTMLEEIIFKQIQSQLRIIVVRGVVESEGNWKQDGNLVTVNFLGSRKLEEIINQSRLIISRSGYSTIMDLARLGKKAVFIPTPGQTEQEFLAKRLMKAGISYSVSQQNFDFIVALAAADSFLGFSNIENGSDLLSAALDEVLK